MKLTTYTDSEGVDWETAEIMPLSFPELLAPVPIWEYYTADDIQKYGKLWVHYAYSYNKAVLYHCIRVKDYNTFVDQYLLDRDSNI